VTDRMNRVNVLYFCVSWSPNIHDTVSFDGALEVMKALEEVGVGKVVMTVWAFHLFIFIFIFIKKGTQGINLLNKYVFKATFWMYLCIKWNTAECSRLVLFQMQMESKLHRLPPVVYIIFILRPSTQQIYRGHLQWRQQMLVYIVTCTGSVTNNCGFRIRWLDFISRSVTICLNYSHS
jgi:hypothetical protein